VSVPPRTPAGQYLAGITVQSETAPRPVQAASNGSTRVRSVVIVQDAVAVVITVGAHLQTRLQVSDVQGTLVGTTPRLNLLVANTGQTFARGRGSAACSAGDKHAAIGVTADTLLPHEQAVIAANAPAFRAGTSVSCTVRLSYGNDQQATWSGRVTFPGPPHTRTYHVGPGVYASVPESGIPAWVIALYALGAVILVLLVVLLIRSRRSVT
jgi:hypothetical protein